MHAINIHCYLECRVNNHFKWNWLQSHWYETMDFLICCWLMLRKETLNVSHDSAPLPFKAWAPGSLEGLHHLERCQTQEVQKGLPISSWEPVSVQRMAGKNNWWVLLKGLFCPFRNLYNSYEIFSWVFIFHLGYLVVNQSLMIWSRKSSFVYLKVVIQSCPAPLIWETLEITQKNHFELWGCITMLLCEWYFWAKNLKGVEWNCWLVNREISLL